MVPYFYADNQIVEKFGYAKPLRIVKERLDLLGFSIIAVERRYRDLVESPEFRDRNDLPSFSEFRQRLAAADVNYAPPDFDDDDHGFGEFFAERIFPVVYRGVGEEVARAAHRSWGEVLDNLHPWAVLRLLAENPGNLDQDVAWRVMDVVEGGYSDASEFVPALPDWRRFLIVTEGTSDAKVLAHALALLRPHIADFFYFVDMEKGYPFTGTGNLHRFAQGLASIGILNRVVFVYDNDAEGCSKHAKTSALALLPNLRCIRLPDHPDLVSFATLGPEGSGINDINGSGASIECYLDHRSPRGYPPLLRWTNYVPAANRWQGALDNKELYVREFLSTRCADAAYDFSRMEVVISALIAHCQDLAAVDLGRLG